MDIDENCNFIDAACNKVQEFESSLNHQQVTSLIKENNFSKKKDGLVDSRDSNFRKCLTFASGKNYPVNKDGSPDMRCTKNENILKMKLMAMMDK